LCFFFSSRRRHTRCLSDWSSDVCSSDLKSTVRVIQIGIVARGCAAGVKEASMRFLRLAGLLSLLVLAAPCFAQTSPTPPPPPPPAAAPSAPQPKPGDAFGEEVTLTAKTIVFSKGSANWDSAFETLVETFKNVYGALQKQG